MMEHDETDIPDPFDWEMRRRNTLLAILIAALAALGGACGLLHDLDKPGQSPEDREQIERNWTP